MNVVFVSEMAGQIYKCRQPASSVEYWLWDWTCQSTGLSFFEFTLWLFRASEGRRSSTPWFMVMRLLASVLCWKIHSMIVDLKSSAWRWADFVSCLSPQNQYYSNLTKWCFVGAHFLLPTYLFFCLQRVKKWSFGLGFLFLKGIFM